MSGRISGFHLRLPGQQHLHPCFEAAPDDEIAQQLIELFGLVEIGRAPRFVTSQMTLAETLIQPIRIGDVLKREQYRRLLSSSSPWLHVRTVGLADLSLAAEVHAGSRLKLPDAIHAATAILSGCSHILKADGDFQKLSGTLASSPVPLHPTQKNVAALKNWLRAR
jgi:predicted nucleic acid-binding protein